MRVMKRVWMPLLIVFVIGIGVMTVMRVRTFFGHDDINSGNHKVADDTKPFNPKVVKYEIFGDGRYADVNYLNLDAQPQHVGNATLPWSLVLSTTDPSVFPNIVAQGDGSTISCRITVDGEVKDEKTSNGVNAQTFCLVKSA
jgi:hypothetical protein